MSKGSTANTLRRVEKSSKYYFIICFHPFQNSQLRHRHYQVEDSNCNEQEQQNVGEPQAAATMEAGRQLAWHLHGSRCCQGYFGFKSKRALSIEGKGLLSILQPFGLSMAAGQAEAHEKTPSIDSPEAFLQRPTVQVCLGRMLVMFEGRQLLSKRCFAIVHANVQDQVAHPSVKHRKLVNIASGTVLNSSLSWTSTDRCRFDAQVQHVKRAVAFVLR